MPIQPKYNFSFTSASSLIAETLSMVNEYHKLNDWEKVKVSAMADNLLLKVKQSTITRQFREIKKRLVLLTESQLELLTEGTRDEAKSMIFVGMLKTYPFLKDFVVEVVRNKYLHFEAKITERDYDRFFESKLISHPELSKLSDSTARKVKQVIFRMLEEVGLLSIHEQGEILKPILSQQAHQIILKDDPFLLSCFLRSDHEIKDSLKTLKNFNNARV